MWLMSDKMEIGRSHLGGPVEHSEGKGRESVVAILMFLCCSPRLCRLRTEGLVPVSKYWIYRSHVGDMGSVSIVACCQKMFGFLHCFIGWLRREIGYGPADRSVDVLWIVSGALSLRSSDSVQLYQWLVKGCHVRGLPTGSIHRAYVDWCEKRTCHGGRVFPCRVYIDSNHRDYQIWLTACSWLPSSSNLLD
jgi:hypothetical protein